MFKDQCRGSLQVPIKALKSPEDMLLTGSRIAPWATAPVRSPTPSPSKGLAADPRRAFQHAAIVMPIFHLN
jgi:hypothetical protein